MTDQEIIPVTPAWTQTAWITRAVYERMHKQASDDPHTFWLEQARRLDWQRFPTKVKQTDFHGLVRIKWFEDGQLNVSANCLDRHLQKRPQQPAIIWEGDNPDEDQVLTYQDVYEETCRLANALRKLGVKPGDRVAIYMPMIPEVAFAMLACTRIGAVHTVVFGGFSATALKDRILDCDAKVLITADGGRRGGKVVPLKPQADEALQQCPNVKHVIVAQRVSQETQGKDVAMKAGRDHWYHDLVREEDAHCTPAVMNAEDPLFILYTSGSTGKPKGLLHTTGGYLLYAAITHQYVFDVHDNDVYWCTADVGWVTGHSYGVYGPLANGATTVMFEGVPNYPDSSRFWQIIDKHKVSIFYTAPTAIRALMRDGEDPVKKTSRKSLRILGTVGEPINPEAWRWYYRVVGDGRCPVIDTWWQTETGGHLISPLPGATDLKPGSATLPLFGIKPVLLDDAAKPVKGAGEGNLCMVDSWPGQARTIWGDHERFRTTYFTKFPGYYFTGDGARRDTDGYYWITGRVDDVINVAGHRLGTAEIESALVLHPAVAEAAVVGMPHAVKGTAIFAYVTVKAGITTTDALRTELIQWVRKEISPIASPEVIEWAAALPKTRSGKIMRRILRAIAAKEFTQLGDTSTLADPAVVDTLIAQRKAS